MAKIKALISFSGPGLPSPVVGDVVDVTDAQAQDLIRAGHAEAVKAPAKKSPAKKRSAKKTETATAADVETPTE